MLEGVHFIGNIMFKYMRWLLSIMMIYHPRSTIALGVVFVILMSAIILGHVL